MSGAPRRLPPAHARQPASWAQPALPGTPTAKCKHSKMKRSATPTTVEPGPQQGLFYLQDQNSGLHGQVPNAIPPTTSSRSTSGGPGPQGGGRGAQWASPVAGGSEVWGRSPQRGQHAAEWALVFAGSGGPSTTVFTTGLGVQATPTPARGLPGHFIPSRHFAKSFETHQTQQVEEARLGPPSRAETATEQAPLTTRQRRRRAPSSAGMAEVFTSSEKRLRKDRSWRQRKKPNI